MLCIALAKQENMCCKHARNNGPVWGASRMTASLEQAMEEGKMRGLLAFMHCLRSTVLVSMCVGDAWHICPGGWPTKALLRWGST